MKTIWKFPFVLIDIVTLSLPGGAEILTLQVQDRVPCLWIKVYPDSPLEIRKFRIYGTGHQLSDDPRYEETYVGTYQQDSFVWHVFEIGEVE